MITNHTAYLPTDKFYSIPQYEDYIQAKNEHLQNLDPDYPTYDAQAKWSLLMPAFTNALEVNDMPGLSRPEFIQRLNAFKTKREATSGSYFNLSLTQCDNYFEEFYFLYTTTDPRYQLTPAAKKNLLNSIKEAIGTCETGINGRFYTALQDHKKDSDWIQNELSKARCETLHQLHQQYGGEDIHTYNKLVALANQENLGIITKEEILDIHAGMVDTHEVETFFQKQYPILYEIYEKQTIDNLTNHYLSEIASTLEIDSSAWSAGELNIPIAKTTDLQKSIEGHFKDVHITGIVDSLGEMSEDYTEFTLKTKQDIVPIIKRLVTEKLLADQYYVSVDAVADNRDAHQNLRISKHVTLDDVTTVSDALKQEDLGVMNDALRQHPLILAYYPELALSRLQSNPALVSALPFWLKTDTRFLDAAMITLNEMLCEAILENNNLVINQLTTHVLTLIKTETGYLQAFSETVLNHPLVAKRLPTQNNAYFNWLNDTIEPKEFMAHVDNLNPPRLLEIIEQRKELYLSPLPFFNHDKAIHDLTQFNHELQRIAPNWDQPYLSTRRKACEHENFSSLRDPHHKKNAVTYVSQTNTWFTGFTQYHAYQTSLEKLWRELIIAVIACYELVVSMIKVCGIYWVFTNIIPMVTQLIEPYFLQLVLSSCVLSQVNYWLIGSRLLATASDILATASDILWRIAFLDWEIFIMLGLILIMEVVRCVYHAYNVVVALFTILCTAFDIMASILSPLWQDTDPNNTLENVCENIIVRLASIDASYAQEKSDVLRTLLSQVKADVSDEAEHRSVSAEMRQI